MSEQLSDPEVRPKSGDADVPETESLPEPALDELVEDPYDEFSDYQDDEEDEGLEGPITIRNPSAALNMAQSTSSFDTGMCLRFVRTMFGVPAKYRTAAIAWGATKHRHTSVPPAGVPVWWTGGRRGFGHVAVSAGDGFVISTDCPSRGRVGKVAIKAITQGWGQTYRGWSEDINDVRVFQGRPKSGPSASPFPDGLAPGKSSPSAVPLQRLLKAAGFMPKSVQENPNYGPKTQDAVAEFHDKHPQFKSPGTQRDVKIGPKGWAFLHKLAQK